MKQLAAFLAAVMLLCLSGCLPLEMVPSESTQTKESPIPLQEEPTLPSTVPTEKTEPSEPPAESEAEPEDTDFVRVSDYIPDAQSALAYATEDNFTGETIYDFSDAYLRYGTVRKLAKAADLLRAQGYGIVIWDGYRPVYAQERLWEICPDPTYVSKPGTGSQNHCRGLAVDLTLYDLVTGELLEMPTGFDDFTTYADRDYGDCTAAAANNAKLLEEIMLSCGFKPYSAEWWHYNDTDTYPIEYDFDPAQAD